MPDPLMSRDEAAALLGIAPDSVRATLRRYGIHEQRGYPRDQVEALTRVGQGRRTDLHHARVLAAHRLRPGERRLVDHVLAQHPRPVTRDELAEHLEVSRGTLRAYLATLRRHQLIADDGHTVRRRTAFDL